MLCAKKIFVQEIIFVPCSSHIEYLYIYFALKVRNITNGLEQQSLCRKGNGHGNCFNSRTHCCPFITGRSLLYGCKHHVAIYRSHDNYVTARIEPPLGCYLPATQCRYTC